MKLRVFLADPHNMFRQALQAFFEKESGFAVVGETGKLDELPHLLPATDADLLLLDAGPRGAPCADLVRRLLARQPQLRIVALSASCNPAHVNALIEAGILAFVSKRQPTSELLRAIESARNRRFHLCPEAAEAISSPDLPAHGAAARSMPLGAREREVLQLIAEGHTSGEIARRLNLAPSTVDVHRRNIMRKLDLHRVAELTRYAVRNGLASG